MTQVTVKELAQVVDTPVERLLQQMREAGLPHTDAGQVVTDNEKQVLLTHLKSSHKSKAEEPRKITLQRKTTTKLKVGGSKPISVEVRKKKTFVKRSAEEIEADQRRELEEQRAAEEALRLCRMYGCEAALLKERSPSCGHGVIHNGLFNGGLVEGDGVTAELLLQNGIAVYGESEWEILL